jgi:hypothetical protein
MSTSNTVDGKYYEVAGPGTLGERLVTAARDRMYADFMRLMSPTPDTRILDVGVSDVVGAGANMLERLYPHPDRITAAGLGAGDDFRSAFPATPYVRIEPSEQLPFQDNEFDISCANAVLEHVGSAQNQRVFIQELARVAKRVFLTVPHRYFPVEHHTAIPLLHFTDPTFRLACRVTGKSSWAQEKNLILMTRSLLDRLCPPGASRKIGTTGLSLGPFSSNLYLCLG